jgi:ribonuclease P protein subunit RPR2
MERLLDLAAGAEPEFSTRYVRLAWRLSTRHRVRMGPEMKARFCRKCFGYLKPGESVRTRVARGRVVTTCLRCGAVRRRPVAPSRR